MADSLSPRTSIAAQFQNAMGLLPPIGVFWDIENCHVPRGKSAIALVQRIREQFFQHHREAEFMCVCDINKESKFVIQELLFAQVTVVHISSTSKNAADDKLKQCMKRYVDTHRAPSSLLLISDDINFASDLSDFRHRHNVRIVLLHRGHAHQSLLACAHEHHNFFTLVQDLPARSLLKTSSEREHELEVSNLPIHRQLGHVKNKLLKLCTNCGGKVVNIRGSRATVKFATPHLAEKAKKRMDKELIFGNRINVSYMTKNDVEDVSPQRSSNEDSSYTDNLSETSSVPSSRDSSLSPGPTRKGTNSWQHKNCFSQRKFDFPPPPLLDHHSCPSFLQVEHSSTDKSIKAPPSQPSGSSNSFFYDRKNSDPMDWNSVKPFSQMASKYQEIPAFPSFNKDHDIQKTYSHKNVGRVSPFFMQDCDHRSKKFSNDVTCRNQARSETQNAFSMYSSQCYRNITQNASFQRMTCGDPVAQWASGCLSTDSYSHSKNALLSSDVSSPVELHVSNLDSTFEVNEMKKILLSVFSEHVMVIHISMSLQPDGSAKAMVKVPSFQDAQFAISRLHRRKIGHKRILISYTSSDKNPPFHILKFETISLLNDIPARNLPLIKFRELYEKRYHRPIAVSELYKMRDAVSIQGDSGSRMVYLCSEFYKSSTFSDSEESQESNAFERAYCERHFQVSESEGWAEQYSVCPLPLVHISLRLLSTAVHMLLDSHRGALPLISFKDCYEAEIGPLPVVGNCEDLEGDPKGVPLEHLIACVTGVEVAKSVFCFKKVQWLENKLQKNHISENFSPALVGQLTLFGREVMDLLKSQPQCLVAFNKFIPTYHHHFGRQCRVADYGFTKLIDLLEAVPHIVQVLGEGQNRQVTLTHRTQVKRFSSELLRILKSRASKQITTTEFPQGYEQVIEKPFRITNYGVCDIQDLLDEMPETIIVITTLGTDTVIGIPKREQTPEEVERTEQFSSEVKELMKHTPCCSMIFSKFIPSYHHHFGKQCRVSDYGFTKLIELFEAIPSVLEVKGSGEDKILSLVPKEQHLILAERLMSIMKSQTTEFIELSLLSAAYTKIYGHVLKPFDFGFSDLHQLIKSINLPLKMESAYGRSYVKLVENRHQHQMSLDIRRILMEQRDGRMKLKDFMREYNTRHRYKINIAVFLNDMIGLVEVDGTIIYLTPLQMLARQVILLLQENEGQISYNTFGATFQKKFASCLCVADYGFSSISEVFDKFPEYFVLKGPKQKRLICLNHDTIGIPLPDYKLPDQSLMKPCGTSSILNSKIYGRSSSIPELIPSVSLQSASNLPEPSGSLESPQIKMEPLNSRSTPTSSKDTPTRSKSTPTNRRNRLAAHFTRPIE